MMIIPYMVAVFCSDDRLVNTVSTAVYRLQHPIDLLVQNYTAI